MADKFTLARPGGNVGRVTESDFAVIGGIKTVSAATDLGLRTEGAGSNLQISIDALGTGGIFGAVGSGGINLQTLGSLIVESAESSYVHLNANSPVGATFTIEASNSDPTGAALFLWADSYAQLGVDGSKEMVELDTVSGIAIDSPVAINIGNRATAHGPIFIGVQGNDQEISIGNLNDATPVTVHAGTSGLGFKSTQDITFDARGCSDPLTYNQVGDLDLNPSYKATSIIGAFNEIKASITTTIETEVGPGTTVTVDSIPTTGTGGAEWFYTLNSNDNIRSGKIGCAWESTTPSVKYWEFGTTDIGDTSDVTIQVVHTGTHIELQLTNVGASDWTFNATRSIAGVGTVGQTPSGWNDITFPLVSVSGTLETWTPQTDGMAVYYLVITDTNGNVSERTLSMAWSIIGGITTYSVSTTPDIGDTSPVNLEPEFVGGDINLNITVVSGTWTVAGTKYMRSV